MKTHHLYRLTVIISLSLFILLILLISRRDTVEQRIVYSADGLRPSAHVHLNKMNVVYSTSSVEKKKRTVREKINLKSLRKTAKEVYRYLPACLSL